MEIVELKKDVYWVGAIDWNIRDFHGYSTNQGTTYNAYLVLDQKPALIDTVKAPFFSEMFTRISKIIDPSKIEYVISNHIEMDHSGSLPQLMERLGNSTLVTTERGRKGIEKYFQKKFGFQTVKTGDTLSLGRRTLTFIEAPMLHWPDSMFTYLNEENILFTNDAFGQHYASMQRYEDEVAEDLMRHAAKYYANILWPLAPLILKKIDEVTKLDLPIDIIAPSHGLIWRRDPSRIIKAYVDWSRGNVKNKALIVYDTMWGSTELLARCILSALSDSGIEAKLLHLRANHRSDIVTEMLDAKGILIGSPTLNNGMFPTVSDFVTYIKGLRPTGKVFGLFESFGWGGGAAKEIRKQLEEAKFDVWEKELRVQFCPSPVEIELAFNYGRQFADRLIGR